MAGHIVRLVRPWLAQAIARRPVLSLAVIIGLAAIATLVAFGAGDRLVVGGGLERGQAGGEEELELTLTPRGQLSAAVEREALTVIESGLVSDPAVVTVSRAAAEDGQATTFLVSVRADSAAEVASAARLVGDRVDPGPFELGLAGETESLAEARATVEDELPGLLLLALPFALLVLGLGFGLRLAVAPVAVAAVAGFGGIAILRLLPGSLDLTAAGVAVSAALGTTFAIEACAAVRRAHGEARYASQEAMVAEALGVSLPRIAWAAAAGVVAAAVLLLIPFPSARSAALGGASAALLAALAAPVAMASAVALDAPGRPEEPPPKTRLIDRLPLRMAFVADEIMARPALAWIPALLGLAALVLAAAPALDLEGVALTPAPGTIAEDATDLLVRRGPWILGVATLAALAAAYLATRSVRLAVARGVAAALPAGAACGLLVLAADGSLPFEVRAMEHGAYASTFVIALAALGAVGATRAALGGHRGVLLGTLVATAGFAALGGAELDAVAQVGIVVAAGLLIDLAVVRAIVVPCLERALPRERPSLSRVPRPRLPDRFRR